MTENKSAGDKPNAQSAEKGSNTWIIVVICCFMIAVVVSLLVARRSASRTSAPPLVPHLKFFINTSGNRRDDIELTNSFLVRGLNQGLLSGCLFIPCAAGQSNVVLHITVRNNSAVLAELPIVSISIPEKWADESIPGWDKAHIDAGSYEPRGAERFSLQTFDKQVPTLPGNTEQELPILPIRVSAEKSNLLNNPFVLTVLAMNFPRLSLQSSLGFLETNRIPFPITKPIVIQGVPTSDGMMRFQFSEQDLRESQK